MLPENEWKWPSHKDGTIADWELNVWLNYEYARSYSPMVKWVTELRATTHEVREVGELPPTRRDPPRFAFFLSKHFPEFPKQPWLTIPQPQRWERLARAGIPEDTSPFDQSTVQEIDLDSYSYRTAIGDCSYDPGNMEDATHLLVKIDFRRTPEQIDRRLRQIVARRRRELKELHLRKVQYHTEQQFRGPPPADPTEPTHNRKGVGSTDNARVFYDRMSQLSALRLCVYFEGDMRTLQEASKLYETYKSWLRAKNAALDVMMWLGDAWGYSIAPPCIIHPLTPHQITVPRAGRSRSKLPLPGDKRKDAMGKPIKVAQRKAELQKRRETGLEILAAPGVIIG